MLERLRGVSAGTLWLLLRTFGLLLVARAALAVLPVRWVMGWQGRVGSGGLTARDVRWAVLVVARYSPVRFVCFPQCLAARALLRGAGVESRLHYGVRRGGMGRLETHTWLEAGGEMVIGGEVAGEFSLLESY